VSAQHAGVKNPLADVADRDIGVKAGYQVVEYFHWESADGVKLIKQEYMDGSYCEYPISNKEYQGTWAI